MARSGRIGSLVTVVTAFILLAAPLPALAVFDFAIRLQTLGGYDETVHDNDPEDLNPAAFAMTLIPGLSTLPAIPGFLLNVGAFTTSPGGPPNSLLDLNWTMNSFLNTGGDVTVTASATDYMFPPSGNGSVLTSSIGGNAGGGSVTAQQWVNLNNALFGMVLSPGIHGPFTSGAFGSSSLSVGFVTGGAYSITDQLRLSLGASALSGGDLQSTVVPEPVTMFLGGTGLLVLAYAGRRRLFGR